MEHVVIVAKISLRPGCRDDAIEALAPVARAVGLEAGTLQWTVLEPEDPDSIWVYEVYADQAAVDAHLGGDALKAAYRVLEGRTTAPAELTRLTPALTARSQPGGGRP